MKRIKELDFTRVIAMFAVVMIHVTSTYINQDSSFILFDMNLAFILNQVSRFSVPLFIVLSGISLGFSKPIGDPLLFYKKRLVKIGIPYVSICSKCVITNPSDSKVESVKRRRQHRYCPRLFINL